MDAVTITLLHDPTIMVSAAELGKMIGMDMDTLSNWNRRDLISRFEPGGRRLRTRLYSVEQVYKTALMKELVDLHFPPLAAREAVNAIWRQLNKRAAPEEPDIYAMLMPTGREEWNVTLCARKEPNGPLYKYKPVKLTSPPERVELPKQAVAPNNIPDAQAPTSSPSAAKRAARTYKSAKSTGSGEKVVELPKKAFAMINISNALNVVSANLSKLLAYQSVMKKTTK
jgi:hypothetical protein